MRLKILLLTTLTVVSAIPGNYRSSYSFQRASSSFINNELQHKTAEAGNYSKQGSTDSDEPPKVEQTYTHNEYRKPDSNLPGALESQSQVGWSGMDMGFPGFGSSSGSYGGSTVGSVGRYSTYGSSGSSSSRTYQSSSSRRPVTWGKPDMNHGAVSLEKIDGASTAEHSIDFSKFQAHGFGRDYLAETEGETRKPSQEGTNVIYRPGRRPASPGYGSHTSHPAPKPTTQTGSTDQSEYKYDDEDDLTQQSQIGFEHTDQSQLSSGTLEFGSQKPKLKPASGSYGKEVEHEREVAHTYSEEDLTQQSQVGFDYLEFGSQTKPIGDNRPKPQGGNYGTSGKHFEAHEMEQSQSQSGYGKLEFGSSKPKTTEKLHPDQSEEDLTQQSQIGFEAFGHTDQSQVGFGHLEFGSQTKPTGDDRPKPQPQGGNYGTSGKHFEAHEMGQSQSQSGYGKLEFGSSKPKIEISGSEKPLQPQVTFSRPSEKPLLVTVTYGKPSPKPQTIGYNHGSTSTYGTQYSQQSGYGKLEFGSHTVTQEKDILGHEDQEEDLTQQSQIGFESFGHTDQSQVGFGGLEFGSQMKPIGENKPNTGTGPRPRPGSFGNTQSGFDKLEFGSKPREEPMEVDTHGLPTTKPVTVPQGSYPIYVKPTTDKIKPQETFSRPSEKPLLVTITYGKPSPKPQTIGYSHGSTSTHGTQHSLEFGSHTVTQEKDILGHKDQEEDLTQQSQIGFESFGHGYHDQSQLGFGNLEFGSPKPTGDKPKPKPVSGLSAYGTGSTHIHSHRTTESSEELTQQSQTGFESESESDFWKETHPTGLGKLEIDSQRKPFETQQKETGYFGSDREYSGSSYGSHRGHSQSGQLYTSNYGSTKPLEIGSHGKPFETQEKEIDSGRGYSGSNFGSLSGSYGSSKQLEPQGKLEIGTDQSGLTQQTNRGYGSYGSFSSSYGSSKPLETQDKEIGSLYGSYGSSKLLEPQGKLEIGTDQSGLTQQTNRGYGFSSSYGSSKPLETQDKEIGYGGAVPAGSNYGSYGLSSQRGQVSSSSYSTSRQYSSSYGARSTSSYGNSPVKPIYEENMENSDEQMKAIEDIAKFAQSFQDDGTQQKQNLEMQSEEKLEKIEGYQVKEHQLEGIPGVVEEVTTKKPGFWRRLGTSITTTYEQAKEKTKHVVEKVKHNLG